MCADKIAISSFLFREVGEDGGTTYQRAEARPIGKYLEELVIPLGVKYVEVWMPQFVDLVSAERVKEILDSYGVKACGIFNVGGFTMPPRVSVDQKKITLDALDVAGIMGPQCKVIVQPGWYTEYGWTIDHALENLYINFKPCAKWAEDRGVTICFEIGHELFDRADMVLEFMKKIDSPNVRVNYCPGSLSVHDDPIYGLEVLKDYVANCHFWDAYNLQSRFSASYPGRPPAMLTPIGYGRVNYDQILRRLKEIGYSGFITLEPFVERERVFDVLEKSVEYVRARYTWRD